MAISIVDPNSTEIEHLASVDVRFSGAHIGGGIYFSANHNPTPGGSHTAIPQRSLVGEAESHGTTELDYTLPAGGEPWNAYRDDLNGDGTPDLIKAGFDMSLQVGERLSTGEFYAGPSATLLIANDPNDLFGNVIITGYPNAANSLNGSEGYLHETSGTLAPGGYTTQTVAGDTGGYFTISGAEAVPGMSGGGNFLDYEIDGVTKTYLIGSTARAYTVVDSLGTVVDTYVESTSFSPQYADLATAIEGLTGDAIRTADDFPRITMLSAQSLGSSLTTVQGQFFHEDIFGGVNDDILFGAGGNDYLSGGLGADFLDGGDGNDTIDGGDGGDMLTGGLGADLFAGSGFGGGATDTVTDFDGNEDVIDLSSFFSTLDEVVAATTEQGDGSILISLPLSSGGGNVAVLNTTISDLTTTNVNVVCFTKGVYILTIDGERLIETLAPGALIQTYDGSFSVLRAVCERKLGVQELRDRPHLWPTTIETGSLGEKIPGLDLHVSPQHRILVNSKIADRMFGTSALIAAKKMTSIPGVCQPVPCESVTYIHLVFDRHEVVRANGCWSESFYPGEQAVLTLPDSLVEEYSRIFKASEHIQPAAPLASGSKAKSLIERHRKHARSLQTA